MLKFNASAFYEAAGWLHRIEGITAGVGKDSDAAKADMREETRKEFIYTFRELRRHLEVIGANLAIMSVDRALNGLKKKEFTYGEITQRIEIINGRLMDELSLVRLYVFDKNRAVYFDSSNNLFGESVSNKFPSAIPDIEDAGRCIACAQGTAAVFHLMRVMEAGLKALSSRLDILYAPSWESHMHQIMKKINTPHNEKSKDWKSIEPFCRDIMGDLQIVKVAWRNPTMHVVRRYSPDEAEAIFGAVKGFMIRLSSELQEAEGNTDTPLD